MDKIIVYIPQNCDNIEEKEARKEIERLKRSGFRVEIVNKWNDMNFNSTENGILYKITANVLNVREKPTVFSKKVGQVRKNEVYTIVEVRGEWGRLKSGLGWISLEYAERG
jgi:hypothetical protein|nr:MAG TPA: SH3 domain protein [Caudoviricetes sp.]